MTLSKKWGDLIKGLFYDAIGMVSYLIPGWGELIDAVWVPISKDLIKKMYGNKFFEYLQSIEEGLPGVLDWVPTFTIAWFWNYYLR